MMRRAVLSMLAFYRRWISPALHSIFPGGCRFHPTCSQYAIEAVELYGSLHGIWLALRRLARCHPFARGGLDPVPLPPSAPDASMREPNPLP